MTDQQEQAPAIRESFRFVGEIGPLFAALAMSQLAFKPIEKDSTAIVDAKEGKRGYTFDYAGLDVVIASTLPALNANGLSVIQIPDANELVTVLAHSSGAYIQATCALPGWNRIQEFGSAITYIRRYCWLSIVGAFPAQEDDDANVASGNQATVTQRQRQQPPPTKMNPAAGAITTETRDRVWKLAQKVGFTKQDLDDFSKKNALGALGGLSELNGLVLIERLETLQVQP